MQPSRSESDPSTLTDSGGGQGAAAGVTETDDDGAICVPEHSFVPVTPASPALPRADNDVIVQPVPSCDDRLSNKRHSDIITRGELCCVSKSQKSQKSSGERRTLSLSSSEHGSSR